jgi:hypothetical protein
VVVPPELAPPEDWTKPPVPPPDPDGEVLELQLCNDKAAVATTPKKTWVRQVFIVESLRSNAVSWSWGIMFWKVFSKKCFHE